MDFLERLSRHLRLTALNYSKPASPPFLVLYVNSTCNQTCEHCFYWRNLNRKDDLSIAEFKKLSESLGTIETLNLSGGEPFLRPELGEICRIFIRNNGVRQIYVPTNGSFRDRTLAALEQVFQEPSLDLFAVELSLDGMPEFHNAFRGMKDAFERAMDTYDGLAEMQKREPRLRIHAISTATGTNIGEIGRLSAYLYDRCPAMEHHGVGLIRGDRKNPSLQGPALAAYQQLYGYVRNLWAPRTEGRYGALMEPMLQHAKTRTAQERRQVVPCRAGILNAVVYSNGDVSVCEGHTPLGNLREHSFAEIWSSEATQSLRRSIANKECHCTAEVWMWPSINYQPLQLVKIMLQSKPWQKQDGATTTAPPSSSDADQPSLRIV